jgi:hypothetical protein
MMWYSIIFMLYYNEIAAIAGSAFSMYVLVTTVFQRIMILQESVYNHKLCNISGTGM